MAYEFILTETRGLVCIITMNRPERLNAWRPDVALEMGDAMRAANADPKIGAIVVTGAGRGFCSGADLKASADTGASPSGSGTKAGVDWTQHFNWIRLVRNSKPVIGAINGPAIGIGLSMTMSFDYIIAAEGAPLAFAFVKNGLAPEMGVSRFLVQRVGFTVASELMLSGRTFDPAEAKALGVINEVAAPEALMEKALARGEEFANLPEPSVLAIKRLLTDNMVETDLDRIWDTEWAAVNACRQSPAFMEAVTAFMEKRPPKFR